MGKKGGYRTGPGWSSGMWQAGLGRTLCPHPAAFSLQHEPAARAGSFFPSCKPCLRQKKICQGDKGQCLGLAVIWGGLQERSLLLQPPVADRRVGRVGDVPTPSQERGLGWGGGGEGALTPPAIPVCPVTPAGLGRPRRGRAGGGRGLMSAPRQARATPLSSSPWSPGTSSPRWWPGPPSARRRSCTPSSTKPSTCT